MKYKTLGRILCVLHSTSHCVLNSGQGHATEIRTAAASLPALNYVISFTDIS